MDAVSARWDISGGLVEQRRLGQGGHLLVRDVGCADEDGRDGRAEQQQPGQDGECRLVAVVERGEAPAGAPL